MIEHLLLGIATAISPENLLMCLIGVFLGLVVGVLPGLGSTTGVAILLPVTLVMQPVTALIMLAGIYYGAQYGSSVSSILISTPGESSSVVLTLDGYQMARRGRAGAALSISAISSFIAAILSLVGLLALAQPIADFALNFGPPEMLAIILLGLSTVASFGGENLLRGIIMAAAGVLLSTVGIAAGFTTARYTFGSINLLSGLGFVPMMIGLFALGEVLYQVDRGGAKPIRAGFRDLMLTKDELRRTWAPALRGTGLGFCLGILPGAGATLASFMSYGFEGRIGKYHKLLGSGTVEGVAAPEAANNAAANAAFIPTLALGIPGSGTTAILLGAFIVFGLQPGPLLFAEQPALVWGLLVSFFFGNLFLLVLSLPMAPVFAQALRIPYSYLYPLILFTSFVGAFAVGNNTFALRVVFCAGILGYFMKRFNFPAAPLVLGLVLGPLLERSLVQTSAMGYGDLTIVFQRPLSAILMIAAILAFVGPLLAAYVKKRRGQRASDPAS